MNRPMGIRGTLAICAAVLAATLAASPPAGAVSISGLRNSRYCEIFTITTSPSLTAKVWNTIGQSPCPIAWWDNLDPAALAADAGVPLVVLNGPRHWVIDGASEPNPGPIGTFAGQNLRQAATIDLTKVGIVHPPPYATVTITRDNTWHYRAGSRVYDLIRPSGRVYRMQAYSDIVDPTMTMSDLAKLGSTLALPDGWRFRITRLHKSLDITARGRATILQDELQDTYQRLPKRFHAKPAR